MVYVEFLNIMASKEADSQRVNYYLRGYVETDPHDHHKDVEIHYTDGLHSWNHKKAYFKDMLPNGRELWCFDILVDTQQGPSQKSHSYQVIAKMMYFGHAYESAKQSLWDERWLYPQVIGFSSQTQHLRLIHYSNNSWASSQDAVVTLRIPHSGTSYASGEFTLPQGFTEYAVARGNGGQWEWENTWGNNYRVYCKEWEKQ